MSAFHPICASKTFRKPVNDSAQQIERVRQPASGLRRTALAATSSRLSSSTVDIPGLSGNLAIEATVLFSFGQSERRANVRAWSYFLPLMLTIAPARHRISQSPTAQTPASIASRIFATTASAILLFSSGFSSTVSASVLRRAISAAESDIDCDTLYLRRSFTRLGASAREPTIPGFSTMHTIPSDIGDRLSSPRQVDKAAFRTHPALIFGRSAAREAGR